MSSSLLYAAEVYQLQHLKALCEKHLAITTTAENVAERLLLAQKHQAHQLEQSVLEFIALNGHEVIPKEEWEKVMSLGPDLITELFRTIYNNSEIQPPALKRAK